MISWLINFSWHFIHAGQWCHKHHIEPIGWLLRHLGYELNRQGVIGQNEV